MYVARFPMPPAKVLKAHLRIVNSIIIHFLNVFYYKVYIYVQSFPIHSNRGVMVLTTAYLKVEKRNRFLRKEKQRWRKHQQYPFSRLLLRKTLDAVFVEHCGWNQKLTGWNARSVPNGHVRPVFSAILASLVINTLNRQSLILYCLFLCLCVCPCALH